jgi:hypothetical protein
MPGGTMPVRRWTAEEERDALILEDNAFFEKYPDRTPEGRRFKRARLARMGEGESSESGIIYHDKVEPTFHWRDAIGYAKSGQALAASMHEGQDTALIELNAEEENPFILFLSDTHIGDWSTDYDLFERITDEILETPGLYVALLGDLANMAIRLRGVAEVTGGALFTPEQQVKILDSWLADIAHKVAFATWDNHGVEREEQASGISAIKHLQAKRFVYHGGIGHPDIRVGEQTYRFAVSHRFRGSSIDNPCHAPMRYLRREGHQRELAAMGDYHVPGIVKFNHGGVDKIAINSGSIQIHSPYARRHFSLFTQPTMPGIVLAADQHTLTPYYSVGEWRAARFGRRDSGHC